MTDQLSLFNGALRIVEERKLAALNENRETARLLGDIWTDGAVQSCLEAGLWTFATRTQRISSSPSITPPFGYRKAFSKPTDWVRTAAVSGDEYFRNPLNECSDETGFWFADIDPIFVKYVSNDASYGLNMGIWPQSFIYFVESYLAKRAVGRITKNATRIKLCEANYDKALLDAQSKDCMNDGTKFPPVGSWAAARAGRANVRRSMWNGTTVTS